MRRFASLIRVSIPLKRVKNSEYWKLVDRNGEEASLNPLKAGQEFGAGDETFGSLAPHFVSIPLKRVKNSE